MNARHAARQLALMLLFQQDRSTKLDGLTELLNGPIAYTQAITEVGRTLTRNAQATLEDTGIALAKLIDQLDELTAAAPENAALPLGVANRPIQLPTTEAVAEHLKSALQAVEHGHEALNLPELVILAEEADVQHYVKRLLTAVNDNLPKIDVLIEANSEDWKLPRMMKMDRCILRLAIGEMAGMEGTQASVVIDEAVTLAKAYAEESSYKLINGILGGVASMLREQSPSVAL